MARTQGHDDYDRFHEETLGVDPYYYKFVATPEIRKLKGNRCQLCGTYKKGHDIHHSDYNDINIHTLILLCKRCHQWLHTQ